MITQWDIISSIRPKDNAILYALLIDGTEHDARLIAKKLQGYVRAPQPALAPYVYRFALPEDLDEDTLEKIRVAVREGIEQAKKVNEFMPGGALGNPLFSADTDKEDKDFPTFITLDPSESFFRSAQDSRPLPPPPPPNVENFEQKSISANETEEEIPQIAKTLEEIDNAGYRSDPAETPTPPAKPQKADETGGAPADITQSDTDAVLTEDVLTSIESEEPWPDELSSSAQTSAAALAAEETEPMTDSKVSQPKDELDIQVQAVTSEDLPDNLVPQPHTQPLLTPEISQTQQADLPISDRDMLIKDMEGTTLGQSLDDILLAETKYDMFVDLDKLSAAPKKEAEKTPLIKEAPASAEDAPNDSFNIFDQKIKDQTSFIDLNDVQNITERITQKDLSFLRHTQVPGKQQPPDAPAPAAQDTPAETGLDKTRAYMPLPPAFGRFAAVQEEQEEVMDPFEQMLAASKNKEQTPPAPPAPLQVETPAEAEADAKAEDDTRINEKTEPEKSVTETPAETTHSLTSSTVPQPPVLTEQKTEEPLLTPPQIPDDTQNLSAAADPVSLPPELPTEQIRVCRTETDAEESPADTPADLERHTERENRVVPPPMPSMENTMSENQGDKKPILRIKRKAQPQAPAAPQTPKPLPPSAPAPQIAPAAPQTQPSAPAPQEEKHGTTILRRRPANTFLEKTRTIDHSIELPLSELKKHNWPLEVPLVPTFTLENMTISVNRFAHATAISVIDNPGKLYNPLVLHGASGTGKTHFLHAIGYALSNKYGQENIFITNGVRLSRGIQRYVMEGNIEKFENFISSVKALLIDDIHLIAINEQNRAYLSKLLNDFRTQQKQIVITSKYPPESLAKLEELLNFRLSSGWISELKPASGSARTRIIQKMLNSNGIDITNEDINRFFGKANMSLGTVSRSIRRVRVLEKLIFPQENQEKRSASAIFDQLLATSGEDSSSLIAQKVPAEVNSAPVTGNGEWGRVGFFYPQNHSNMMNWLVFALQQRAKELGISGGPELAVRSSYSTENIISSAFKIANLCDNKKLKAAVILGPETENCEPSVRENFYDILTHMLEVMLIRCGVINYEDVGAPSTYVKILSELLR